MRQALRNLRVPKAASRLFMYYAAQAEGFRPSLKRIDEVTHVGEKNISRLRHVLVLYGLFAYDGDVIAIDWVRLSGLAFADPKMMGSRKHWKLTRVNPKCYKIVKSEVHNYRGDGFKNESERIEALYRATAEAIADGVNFPELRGAFELPLNCEEIETNCGGNVKSEVHNYRVNEFPEPYWYDPFKEPDPPWVWQKPRVDAYGEIVAYDHFDPPPF